MQQDDLTGATVYDTDGDQVGKIEDTYQDENGTVQYARVKIGTLLAKHRLVPIDAAQSTEDGIKVPYSKDAIEHAPDLPDEVNPLSGMVGEDLRGYYSSTQTSNQDNSTSNSTTDSASSSSRGEEATGEARPMDSNGDSLQAGQVRDRGDVVEIPVVEEQLVKEPVVKEVIRVRKTPVVAEEKTVSADLRKEDVQVESQGDAAVREADTQGSRGSRDT